MRSSCWGQGGARRKHPACGWKGAFGLKPDSSETAHSFTHQHVITWGKMSGSRFLSSMGSSTAHTPISSRKSEMLS